MTRADRQRRRAIRRIRREMGLLGYPLDDLTDEQIESGVREFGRIAVKVGVSVREFNEQMARFVAAVNVSPSEVESFRDSVLSLGVRDDGGPTDA